MPCKLPKVLQWKMDEELAMRSITMARQGNGRDNSEAAAEDKVARE
jgi:hypothetical protein